MSQSCGTRAKKSIEHWGKTLKIKGLGPSTIDKLDIDNVAQLYSLTLDVLVERLGSQKNSEKLLAEIQKSISAPLNKVLPAFGIPLIGNTAAQKLCSVISSLEDYTTEKAKQAGLGPKAILNLEKWLEEEYPLYRSLLPFSFKAEVSTQKATKGVVCISGKLTSYKTKAVATEALNAAGYEVKSSITKDVTILVNESGVESAKTKKARESGVQIVSNLTEFLGEV
jgi:DNA ligase (NAD+)